MTEQPTMSINEHGDKVWKLRNGKIHRVNGPAIEYTDGTKEWWFNGNRHRIDGPVVEPTTYEEEWRTNGKCIFWMDK